MSKKTATQLVSKIPRVAVAIETYWVQGRQLLEGILRYVRLHDPWEIRLLNPDKALSLQLDFKIWKPSGLIARGCFAEECGASNVPVVFCDLEYEWMRAPGAPWGRWPEVRVDDQQIGKLGAEHFIRRGYQNLAYCGLVENYAYASDRRKSFLARVRDAGLEAFDYELPPIRQQKWEREQSALARWLRSLPKPIGILACNDLRAQQVLATCEICGLNVPTEVAVLGVDNDELFCELSGVSLSSVSIDSVRGGVRAAELLDNLMRGRETPRCLPTQPLEVVARKSTDFYPVDDELVGRAVRYVNMNINRAISVDMIARYLGCSRRVVGDRFKKAMKTTPGEYIVAAKTERIAALLRATSWPLHKIAEQTGFNSAAYLCEFFLKRTGLTPGDFRRKNNDNDQR